MVSSKPHHTTNVPLVTPNVGGKPAGKGQTDEAVVVVPATMTVILVARVAATKGTETETTDTVVEVVAMAKEAVVTTVKAETEVTTQVVAVKGTEQATTVL